MAKKKIYYVGVYDNVKDKNVYAKGDLDMMGRIRDKLNSEGLKIDRVGGRIVSTVIYLFNNCLVTDDYGRFLIISDKKMNIKKASSELEIKLNETYMIPVKKEDEYIKK
jgi:hypothetical protein